MNTFKYPISEYFSMISINTVLYIFLCICLIVLNQTEYIPLFKKKKQEQKKGDIILKFYTSITLHTQMMSSR